MEEPTTFEKETQPQGLKTLCILTFIYSGIAGFGSLLLMLGAKPLFTWLNENIATLESNPQISETQLQQVKDFMAKGSASFIIACGIYLLIVGLSFFGALQMWQNKYRGFIMYLVANIYFLASNIVGSNFVMAAIDLLFILLYFRYSKTLEK